MDLKREALKKTEDIGRLLKDNGYQIGIISEKPFNFEITTSKNNRKYKVQVYFGKKGIKTVVQGNGEDPVFGELTKLVSEEPELAFKNNETEVSEPEEYIGSDESGKGDIFGPLVICSVFLDSESRIKLERLGVRDSKKLSEDSIGVISAKIKTLLKDKYEVVLIPPETYNRLYENMRNLNKILEWGHSKAIENLLSKKGAGTVIVDKFSSKIPSLLDKLSVRGTKLILTTKAERFVGVAAASIIARDAFNKWFEREEFRGFDLKKGASQIAEEAAARLYGREGGDILRKTAKTHFKTIQRILNPT